MWGKKDGDGLVRTSFVCWFTLPWYLRLVEREVLYVKVFYRAFDEDIILVRCMTIVKVQRKSMELNYL